MMALSGKFQRPSGLRKLPVCYGSSSMRFRAARFFSTLRSSIIPSLSNASQWHDFRSWISSRIPATLPSYHVCGFFTCHSVFPLKQALWFPSPLQQIRLGHSYKRNRVQRKRFNAKVTDSYRELLEKGGDAWIPEVGKRGAKVAGVGGATFVPANSTKFAATPESGWNRQCRRDPQRAEKRRMLRIILPLQEEMRYAYREIEEASFSVSQEASVMNWRFDERLNTGDIWKLTSSCNVLTQRLTGKMKSRPLTAVELQLLHSESQHSSPTEGGTGPLLNLHQALRTNDRSRLLEYNFEKPVYYGPVPPPVMDIDAQSGGAGLSNDTGLTSIGRLHDSGNNNEVGNENVQYLLDTEYEPMTHIKKMSKEVQKFAEALEVIGKKSALEGIGDIRCSVTSLDGRKQQLPLAAIGNVVESKGVAYVVLQKGFSARQVLHGIRGISCLWKATVDDGDDQTIIMEPLPDSHEAIRRKCQQMASRVLSRLTQHVAKAKNKANKAGTFNRIELRGEYAALNAILQQKEAEVHSLLASKKQTAKSLSEEKTGE